MQVPSLKNKDFLIFFQFEKRNQEELQASENDLNLFSCDDSSIHSLGLPRPAPIPGLDSDNVPHPDLIK